LLEEAVKMETSKVRERLLTKRPQLKGTKEGRTGGSEPPKRREEDDDDDDPRGGDEEGRGDRSV
jgi:hypothetical protein